MTTLVAIPAIAAHRPVVELSLAQVRNQLTNAKFLIVTPDTTAFAGLEKLGVEVHHDNVYAPVDKRGLTQFLAPGKRHLPGWYYQQLLKYAVISASSSQRTLILDADTVVVRDIRAEPGTFFTARERNEGYFEHYRKLMGRAPSLAASAITNFMWFESDALREMLAQIEKRHGQLWWRAILEVANGIAIETAFSEYETYANWYAAETGQHVEIPINMFRRGDLLLKHPSDYQRVLSATSRKGYDAVAFELNHRSSSLHRIGMRAVLHLGLKVW